MGFHIICSIRDADAAALVARYLPALSDWPLVVVANGTALKNPERPNSPAPWHDRRRPPRQDLGCRRRKPRSRSAACSLFVGADPATGWLEGCGVTLDRAGFVVTGAQSEQNQGRLVAPLETSVPGVFAVGDVRSGSVKRVGGAIGEGAQVVAALHGFLGETAKLLS